MGYSNDEEAGASSPGVEETLPLYEESENHQIGELKAPDLKASPDEVREFLVKAIQARGIGIDHARRVASRWNLGTGAELRTYPPAMYREIFGAEDGWAAFKAAKMIIYREEMTKSSDRWTSLIVATVALAVLCGAVATATHVENDLVFIIAVFAGVGSGFAMVISTCVAIGVETDPEKKVDGQLQAEWNKTPNNK